MKKEARARPRSPVPHRPTPSSPNTPTAAHASHERTLSSASGYAHHHVAGTAKSTTSPTKQRYVADAHGLEIVKKIQQDEVELRDRTIVLCDIKANVRPARFAKLRAIKDAKKLGKAPTAIPAVSGLKRLRGRHRGGAGERGGAAARLVMSAAYQDSAKLIRA
ncbi:hypothetical protein HETIRDRAFT_453811 [Heterobasidion irregulare TC 32-1]|uniref:Uncharacterized protein n=1 Tax=Heterobasidion irregulare (strain TC 32-1) TaxID=747525 RepID=W4K216_HETIT|nr:uncharacterized protein HETIRDRAFT_453811 [Heterobasidion irregulare TC 32-1]ETW79385.1 hypothetical protein HETIRDRAFT_453811 [Heterobasidion irregulare TC 32-1]